MNNLLVVFLVVAVVVLGGVSVFNPPEMITIEKVPVYGSGSGQNHYFEEYFYEGAYIQNFKDGNGVTPTFVGSDAASSTRTLTAAEVCENTVVRMEFRTATGTLTLPTTASLLIDCFKVIGDAKLNFAIWNSSPTSTSYFELAVGASSTLQLRSFASSTLDVGGISFGTSTIAASEMGELSARRVSSSSQKWILWQMEGIFK